MNAYWIDVPYIGSFTVETHKKPSPLMRPVLTVQKDSEISIDMGRIKFYFEPCNANRSACYDSSGEIFSPPDHPPQQR